MPSPFDIAVLGATGAAGEQVLAALASSNLPLGAVTPFGGPARSPRVDSVSYGERTIGVESISRLGDHTPAAAVLCVPSKVASLAPALVARGVFVIDVCNATAGVLAAPLLGSAWRVEGRAARLPDAVVRAGALRTPSAVGAALHALLAPLAAAPPTSVSGVVSLPASARGRVGSEELGQQVIASLTQQDPQRRVWPEGLAFDTLPEDVPDDEWSTPERLAAEEVGALGPLAADRIALTFCTQPLFAGLTAGLHLRGVSYEAAEAAWSDAPGLVAVGRTSRLRPRARLAKAEIAWGRLRSDPSGDGVHVWVTADPLAIGAAAVVDALGRLAEAGVLGGAE
jgi:aspartate-semialdehyde dehydrogenase